MSIALKIKGFFAIALSFSLLLTACAGNTSAPTSGQVQGSSAPEKKEIIFGFTPGPYSDQVKRGIQPLLEKKGYRVKLIEFNDIKQPNFALANGEIDANVFQHTLYFKSFISQNHLDLYELIKVPTAPLGIYSIKYHSLQDAKEGIRVALPNDPVNLARGLQLLQEIGWVKIKPGVDPLQASEKDLAENRKNITFVPLEQAQLPRSLPDVDFALINGNFVIASGMKLSDSLRLENTPLYYQNLVAIRTVDKDKPFVKDIVEAYHSTEFQRLIEQDPNFAGFTKPDYFH